MKRFFEDLGLDPMLSEMSAFPVNPQTSPVANCLRAVKERADIFVLIVGTRYGSQDESGKSITNMEYLEAKAKGVPIYIFVLKPIINMLPVWKKNPQANFEEVVDTPKLFEFVDALRGSQNHWVFEFEEAKHIKDELRHQLAVLFMEGLILGEKVKDLRLSPALTELSGRCLKLLMERPLGWEYRFLGAVLTDEMNADQDLKWDLQYGLKFGHIRVLDAVFQLRNWLLQKWKDLLALVRSLERLMNQAIQQAIGKPGEPGDPELLVYVAKRIARIRKELVNWTIEFGCTEVNPECGHLLSLISLMSKDVIVQIENFPARLETEVNKGIEATNRGEKYVADLIMKLTIDNIEEISAEMEKLPQ